MSTLIWDFIGIYLTGTQYIVIPQAFAIAKGTPSVYNDKHIKRKEAAKNDQNDFDDEFNRPSSFRAACRIIG